MYCIGDYTLFYELTHGMIFREYGERKEWILNLAKMIRRIGEDEEEGEEESEEESEVDSDGSEENYERHFKIIGVISLNFTHIIIIALNF